ncbi:hypothetical protein A9L43_10060 [Pseudomonas mosselii]|nr:hypothetical protein A9L43_10060 [Pseudomonas mosselii]
MYVRLKHMALHFYKYSSRVYQAQKTHDVDVLRATLIDSIIICLASANALKIFLDDYLEIDADSISDLFSKLSISGNGYDTAFNQILDNLLVIGGKMAKIMESTDHMERGDPRAEMSRLVPELFFALAKHVDTLDIDIEWSIEKRFTAIESAFDL